MTHAARKAPKEIKLISLNDGRGVWMQESL